MLKRHFLWLPLLAWIGFAQADNVEMRDQLKEIMPDVMIGSIKPVANTGLYEVIINGEIIYFSEDMQYVFQGDVIELQSRENITENKRVSLRKDALDALNEADMIVYEPKKTEYNLTVFTDIDCGYCRKLHNQMAEYNALGIRIRYLAFPRSGIDSDSFDKAEDVWCASNRQQAMTDAKNGKDVNSEDCQSPVQAQYELGRRLGVTGTPSLFLDSGEILPGYIPPARLKKILESKS
ncbi:MAG: thioredoxin fold domain-containing protein [Piscirickettsiaceae bacterium]|nr:thioredoxin fold domain-containing protein [Piscirickettsiaceae bacterium]